MQSRPAYASDLIEHIFKEIGVTADIVALFDKFEKDGKITVPNKSVVYWGSL